MLLPVSSSPLSATDSEDRLLTKQLVLADTNAELNRFAFSHFDDQSETSPNGSHQRLKSIQFNPEVNVRYIRPRSNTMRSTMSDASASSSGFPNSPRECKVELNDASPEDSDDDDFERFYKTMPPMDFSVIRDGRRRASVDEFAIIGTPSLYTHETDTPDARESTTVLRGPSRTRSVSCDDYFFQSTNIAAPRQ